MGSETSPSLLCNLLTKIIKKRFEENICKFRHFNKTLKALMRLLDSDFVAGLWALNYVNIDVYRLIWKHRL